MNVQKIDYRSPEAAKGFAQSLRETGFAVFTHHPIEAGLLAAVYADWKRFFESEAKHTYRFDPVKQSGYFPFKTENAKASKHKDLKEFFHLFPATPMPDGVGDATAKLRGQLMDMGRRLLAMLDAELPAELRGRLSEPLETMVDQTPGTLFRILHYPALDHTPEPGEVRAAAHEDINLITLLPAATQPGLQVKDTRGKWHDVPCDPGDIVVNAGDMLQLATDHYYISTSHQVLNPTGDEAKKSRYSMPLFLHPRPEVQLSASYSADAYLKERLREIGLIS